MKKHDPNKCPRYKFGGQWYECPACVRNDNVTGTIQVILVVLFVFTALIPVIPAIVFGLMGM